MSRCLFLIASLAFLTLGGRVHAEKESPLVKQAEDIIIKDFSVNDMIIDATLEKLNHLARESDPEKKGASFTLDPAVNKAGINTLTLELKNVPAYEVARFIAQLSGLQLKPGDKAIALVKK